MNGKPGAIFFHAASILFTVDLVFSDAILTVRLVKLPGETSNVSGCLFPGMNENENLLPRQ